MKEERFREVFGCDPGEFTGINAPYEFLGNQEAEDLLNHFGFCHMCIGSGTSWAECCSGYRCSCNGEAVSFTCQCCGGTKKFNKDGEDKNTNHLYSIANSNNGRLATNW